MRAVSTTSTHTVIKKNNVSAASSRSLKINRGACAAAVPVSEPGRELRREVVRVREEADSQIGAEELLPSRRRRDRDEPHERQAPSPTRIERVPDFTSTVVATHKAIAASI